MSAPYLDTSALAKRYIDEPFSEEVDRYLSKLQYVLVSALTAVEFRSLLLRKRRAKDLSGPIVDSIWASFLEDRSTGALVSLDVTDAHYAAATRLLDRTSVPLRALDALHLAVAERTGTSECATADRRMAEAAETIGLKVRAFFD